jgi:hypothetical protein
MMSLGPPADSDVSALGLRRSFDAVTPVLTPQKARGSLRRCCAAVRLSRADPATAVSYNKWKQD